MKAAYSLWRRASSWWGRTARASQTRYQQAYIAQRRPWRYAPYPVDVYASLLARLRDSRNSVWRPFAASGLPAVVNVYARHDIDTAACARQMSWLLEADRRFGLQAGVYFRVDDVEYSLQDYREAAQAARREGFEVGLHTVCYVHDDYLRAFRQETEKFANEAGFAPRTFTVHGLGRHRLEVRLRFYEEIAVRLTDFGYVFSDCHHTLRTYDYVVEDCHWDEARQARFIYRDFASPPGWFWKGRNYLVLTHPCYWTASPGLMRPEA